MDYNRLKEFIPKDKFDLEPIPTLIEMAEDVIYPILPDLLYWIADMNWPVAKLMVYVLAQFPTSVVPLIKGKLKPEETDDEWKYWIIVSLIPKLPVEAQKLLSDDVFRIIDNPTKGERYSEVNEMAEGYVKYYGISR